MGPSTRPAREIRCPECGSWVHRRPGDVYGCRCGCFTYAIEGTAQDAEALATTLREREPEREVVVDYE